MKLFMILLGCRPEGRFTEQHDIFFAIGPDLRSVIPDILEFWPEAKGKIHIDAWREVNVVDGHKISVQPRTATLATNDKGLFFLNLGGYKPGEFDELHYMMLAVASTKAEAIKAGKETAFFKHTGFIGATAHIDDKFGIDIDDIFEIDDILKAEWRAAFHIEILPSSGLPEDAMHLGYLPIRNIK